MRWNRLFNLVGIGVVLISGLSCSGDASEPGAVRTAAAIDVAYGNDQVGLAGNALRAPITVRVTDQQGVPMKGASVAFAVASGGGSVSRATVLTNEMGLAGTNWTLGSGLAPGEQSLTASLAGKAGSPVTFSARVVAQVVKGTGDGQTAEVGWNVAEVPTVIIRDASGIPVAGLAVRWTVTGGGGWVEAPTSATDANGTASMPWALGYSVGAVQYLQASLSPQVATTFSASAVLTSATLAIVAGNNQSGFTGSFLSVSPTVSVIIGPGDFGAQAVQGVEVLWEVVGGGGTTFAGSSATDRLGVASVGWTLGSAVGANSQRLSASVPGLSGPPIVFVASTTTAPTMISKLSGDLQVGAMGQPLPQPLVVRVLDASGSPVANVDLLWNQVYGDGCCFPGMHAEYNTTNGAGEASITVTLLGQVASPTAESVEVRVVGVENVTATFQLGVLPGLPAMITLASGSGQTATVGTQLPLPITVEVRDKDWNPTPGVTVLWAAGPGSGSTSVASSVTDSNGIASTAWTIGATVGAGTQRATATVPGLVGSSVTFTASATAGP
jgi:hypothetical protein